MMNRILFKRVQHCLAPPVGGTAVVYTIFMICITVAVVQTSGLCNVTEMRMEKLGVLLCAWDAFQVDLPNS